MSRDVKHSPESSRDMLERLRSMSADDGETWDLSQNDQAALQWAVNCHEELVAALKGLIGYHKSFGADDKFHDWQKAYYAGMAMSVVVKAQEALKKAGAL